MKRATLTLSIALVAMGAPASTAVPSLAAPGGVRQAGVVDTLLDAMAEAHGGSERMRAIQAIRMEGTLRTPDGGEGRFIRVSRGLGALASLTDMPGRTEIRILSEGQGWRGESHDALQPVQGPLLMAMHMQSTRILAPFLLDAHRDRVTLADDGPDGPTLELQLSDGAVLRARLDPVSHRVAWTQSRLPVQGRVMTFSTLYSDFRSVAGVLVAYREENSAQGVPTALLTVTDLMLNPVGRDLLLGPAGELGQSRASGR